MRLIRLAVPPPCSVFISIRSWQTPRQQMRGPRLSNNLASTPSKPIEQKNVMKKALIAITALAMASASSPAARAGDREWATAGKVLAGVGAGLLLTRALQPPPVYAAPPVYVTPAPVVYQTAPVVVQTAPVQSFVVEQPIQPVATVVQTPSIVVQQPVYVRPAPVIYQPAPVVYAAPVYVQPAPVYIQPAPVYYHQPRPAVGFHFSFGHHGHHGHGHHRHHGRGHR
jgi:hypothetical protein